VRRREILGRGGSVERGEGERGKKKNGSGCVKDEDGCVRESSAQTQPTLASLQQIRVMQMLMKLKAE
jgi:hypothetical protein